MCTDFLQSWCHRNSWWNSWLCALLFLCAFVVFGLLFFPFLAALYHTNGFQYGFPIPSVTAQLL